MRPRIRLYSLVAASLFFLMSGAVKADPLHVPKADSRIHVDGHLEESAWESALRFELDYEIDPGENVPAPVQTQCLVTYDEGHFYVGFRAFDPDPEAIRAHISDRDHAFRDDFVGIMIDTFNDARRAFELFVNPLGVQSDLTRSEVAGGNEDESWDAIWNSSGRITDEGYEVEMAIPFTSLRFQRTDGEQTWGFVAFRSYPRNIRHQITHFRLDRDNGCLMCQAPKIRGFDGATPGRNLEITPTLTASRTDDRPDFPYGSMNEKDVRGDAGATARWGVTPNLTLGLTANPDFSQVEADVAQLDVNTTFALFFPERRPFYVEGADFFDTPFNTVFTRNVADPSWGAKITGKLGRGFVGGMISNDDITNLLLPGSESSAGTSLDRESFDTVLRYRRDILETSTLGVLYTGREGETYHNRVIGLDGLYRPGKSHMVSFQFLGSQTKYPGSVVDDFDQPSGEFEDAAAIIDYDLDTKNWYAYGRFSNVGTDFRADMGFMPQVGYRLWLAGVERLWWGDPEDWYTRINVGADWDLTERQDGTVLERETEVWVGGSGPMQSHVNVDVGVRDRYFNGVTFDEKFMNLYFSIQPSGDLEFEASAKIGDDIDFRHTRPGDVIVLQPSGTFRLGKHLNMTLNYTRHQLDVDGGRLFTANLSELRLLYNFNVRTFVRAILQYQNVHRSTALFDDKVDENEEEVFAQLLFSYKVNPQTVLFLGYSDTRIANDDVDLLQRDRTVFFKIGYAWVL
jgi:hypothetical protein